MKGDYREGGGREFCGEWGVYFYDCEGLGNGGEDL